MCSVCGCSGPGTADGHHHHRGHGHRHAHGRDHRHDHAQALGAAHAPNVPHERLVRIERDILAKNDGYAAANRRRLAAAGVRAFNLMSSPGAGKTTLLVRAIADLQGRHPIAVIEGDQQTSNDAERIRATGAPVVQINTGKGCHLDAHMVGHAVDELPLQAGGLLFIENVGNLVCPAAFDLGESRKVVMLSVTEGEDKPEKYPDIFAVADLMLLTKIDLLPHAEFNLGRVAEIARRVNPRVEVMPVSARTGEGLPALYAWLERCAVQPPTEAQGLPA